MRADAPAIPVPAELGTLAALFAWRVCRSPDGHAYREFDAAEGQWSSFTWAQIATQVRRFQQALADERLDHGARVAILLPNGVTAVCVDQACLAAGLVPVPMHAIDNPASIGYIIDDSDAALLVVSSRIQWDAILATGMAMPTLKLVIIVTAADARNAGEPGGRCATVSLSAWLPVAPAMPAPPQPALNADALAAIVYTSGTTGRPKGVMLTHQNVMSNVRAVLSRVAANEVDVFLSFLPLSHTFERTIGYYLPIAAGSCVAFARSVPLIAEDLKSVRPTVLVSVPRIYERFYAKLQETLLVSSPAQRGLFASAQAIGWRQFCRAQKIPFTSAGSAWRDRLLAPLLHRLVARKVLANFGGRLRCAVSGGAPMSSMVAECFLAMGLPLIQGYGMTETSPVVSANALDDNWPLTVGRVIDGVSVRIGENNELQVRGDSVMRGYWKRPDETARALTADGWLRTGDQAAIDDGRIRIIGRIKDILVTSTGEKISPVDLELAITTDPLFEQALVVGEKQPFIAALLVLNAVQWQALAHDMGLDGTDTATLDCITTRSAVLARIQAATRGFPFHAVPRAVRLTLTPWTIQNGLMTPTLKLKRPALLEFFRLQIAEMYLKAPTIVNRKTLLGHV